MKSMTGFGRAFRRSSQDGRPEAKTVLTTESTTAASAAGRSPSPTIPQCASSRPKVPPSSLAGLELDVSVRSVNGRFLEIRLHLPREYSGLENELKSLVSRRLARGTVDVHVNRSRTVQFSAPDIAVNTDLARKWLKSYRDLSRELGLDSEPDLEMLVRIPELFRLEETSDVTADEKQALRDLLSEAVEACDRERVREGAALQAELLDLLRQLEALGDQMEKLKADASQELERRYRERLQKLGLDGAVEPQRLAQEIVMQLDRFDVSEEISRLREHLKVYEGLIRDGSQQGKKLDFYAQELLREVNTIGSKSHITQLTVLVVDAKTLVEKIREQVQNVE